MRPILVSSCLLGLLTRYDGQTKRNEKVVSYLKDNRLIPIPVCPEQLAGLPTPRSKTFFTLGDGDLVLDGGGTVINAQGTTMNSLFHKGAVETLKIARLAGCTTALLKERSPSCGVHQIYLEDTKVKGRGVCAAFLERHGVKLLSEEDL